MLGIGIDWALVQSTRHTSSYLQSSRCSKLQNQTKVSFSPLFGSSFPILTLQNRLPWLPFRVCSTLEWQGNKSGSFGEKQGQQKVVYPGAGGGKPANCYPCRQTAESSIFTRKLSSQVENVPKRYLNLAPLFARTCQHNKSLGAV